jgi:hypothetical protein
MWSTLEHIDSLRAFYHALDHSIDARFTAIEQGSCSQASRVGSRRDIEQSLLGSRVLNDGGGSPFTVRTTGRLLFRSCLRKSPERRRKVVKTEYPE